MFSPLTVTVATHAVPILGLTGGHASGFVVANVGGLDLAGDLPGPDDAYLLADQGGDYPQVFFLLSGAALSLPGDLSNVYARAVTSTTTLTFALGTRP